MTDDGPDMEDVELRWDRAWTWAYGVSFGPYVHGVGLAECRRIEALRDLILECDPQPRPSPGDIVLELGGD